LPHASRAGGPEKWDKMGLSQRNSSVCTRCKRRGEARHQSRRAGITRGLQSPSSLTSPPSNCFRLPPSAFISLPSPSSLTSAPPKSDPLTPAMSRHPRFTDSFSSLELASFFAQLRTAIGVSFDRPWFCVYRVWLCFLLFLFRVRVSVPVSRATCRVRPNVHPSSPSHSMHSDISANSSHSPRRRPPRASPSCFRIRIFKDPQRPEATLVHFKYATSPRRSYRPGRPESDFCDSPSGL
jgi:hypothetical protein